ncbi:MAG TPA: asparaginase [Blastocatellia bacterium]|nr:asparaginase [Blastocatellia bacterium]
MKSRIAIFFTGGTISMRFDPDIGAAVPGLSGKDILDNVPDLYDIADIEIIDFGMYPGPHMTPQRMIELSAQLRRTLARDDIDGVVVTHGTDTLEETAFLIDLTVASEKPVAFAGAMRNSSETGWDGPSNLLAATRVASSQAARGLGTLVVMNETVLAASEATKTHTESFDSFQSPDFGSLGVVDKGEVIIRRRPIAREHFATTALAEPVRLLKASSGFDSSLIEACLDRGSKGIVIEGLGRGNLPPESVPGIEQALKAGVPVVLTSRCLRGRVYESYGYAGGGRRLRDAGVIFADFLNGQKARIKLSLALSVTDEMEEIRRLFEHRRQ